MKKTTILPLFLILSVLVFSTFALAENTNNNFVGFNVITGKSIFAQIGDFFSRFFGRERDIVGGSEKITIKYPSEGSTYSYAGLNFVFGFNGEAVNYKLENEVNGNIVATMNKDDFGYYSAETDYRLNLGKGKGWIPIYYGSNKLILTVTDTSGVKHQAVVNVKSSNTNYMPPTTTLPPPPSVVCGNGMKESGEECDDGNKISGDGCSSDCRVEVVSPPPVSVCGNGVVEGSEMCDGTIDTIIEGAVKDCETFCDITTCICKSFVIYHLSVGDEVEIGDHNLKLLDVPKEGLVNVLVDGFVRYDLKHNEEVTINNLKIKNIETFYDINDVDSREASLQVSENYVEGKYLFYAGSDFSMNLIWDNYKGVLRKVQLNNVGSGGAISVTVDGVQETILKQTMETVMGVEITNYKNCYNVQDIKKKWAILLIGDIKIPFPPDDDCEESPVIECNDNDGGKDYYVKGVVTAPNYPTPQEDSCCMQCNTAPSYGGLWVSEYYCKDIQGTRDIHRCEFGCEDGICLVNPRDIVVHNDLSKCADDGNEINLYGPNGEHIAVYGTKKSCYDGTEHRTAVEYYCKSNNLMIKIEDCKFGCDDDLGGCIREINDDSDNDGLPDYWELTYFSDLRYGWDSDPDNDGFVNGEEFTRGINPTIPDVSNICVASPPISCSDVKMDSDGVLSLLVGALEVESAKVTSITLTAPESLSKNGLGYVFTEALKEITEKFSFSKNIEEKLFVGTVEVEYIMEKSTTPHTSTITFSGVVEKTSDFGKDYCEVDAPFSCQDVSAYTDNSGPIYNKGTLNLLFSYNSEFVAYSNDIEVQINGYGKCVPYGESGGAGDNGPVTFTYYCLHNTGLNEGNYLRGNIKISYINHNSGEKHTASGNFGVTLERIGTPPSSITEMPKFILAIADNGVPTDTIIVTKIVSELIQSGYNSDDFKPAILFSEIGYIPSALGGDTVTLAIYRGNVVVIVNEEYMNKETSYMEFLEKLGNIVKKLKNHPDDSLSRIKTAEIIYLHEIKSSDLIDLFVSPIPPTSECNVDEDCYDGDACTMDLCIDTPKRCVNKRIQIGCNYYDQCLPMGTRVGKEFCNRKSNLVMQANKWTPCDNNYECASNICFDNECVSYNILQKVINWVKRIFGGKSRYETETSSEVIGIKKPVVISFA